MLNERETSTRIPVLTPSCHIFWQHLHPSCRLPDGSDCADLPAQHHPQDELEGVEGAAEPHRLAGTHNSYGERPQLQAQCSLFETVVRCLASLAFRMRQQSVFSNYCAQPPLLSCHWIFFLALWHNRKP